MATRGLGREDIAMLGEDVKLQIFEGLGTMCGEAVKLRVRVRIRIRVRA